MKSKKSFPPQKNPPKKIFSPQFLHFSPHFCQFGNFFDKKFAKLFFPVYLCARLCVVICSNTVFRSVCW